VVEAAEDLRAGAFDDGRDRRTIHGMSGDGESQWGVLGRDRLRPLSALAACALAMTAALAWGQRSRPMLLPDDPDPIASPALRLTSRVVSLGDVKDTRTPADRVYHGFPICEPLWVPLRNGQRKRIWPRCYSLAPPPVE
jgi:hypothetical protein